MLLCIDSYVGIHATRSHFPLAVCFLLQVVLPVGLFTSRFYQAVYELVYQSVCQSVY